MANLYNDAATGALNEDEYINKLYDSTLESQKKTLQKGYEAGTEQIDSGKQQIQQQTSDYLKRSYVENDKASAAVGAGAVSDPQAALTMNNQRQQNATTLKDQQSAADQEFERQRQLLAQKYTTQIKQAQADNDMQRAQALYEAAKAEDAQLRSIRESAGTLMYGKGDDSILKAIASGTDTGAGATGSTWDSVLKYEDAINKIYDAQMESQRQAAELERTEGMSALEAAQQEQTRQTDKSLTQAYVDALKQGKNYLETQTAYGQGSGTAAQARLARQAGLNKELTDLRKAQLSGDAQTQQQMLELVKAYGDQIASAQGSTDTARAQALYDAAEGEEQALISEQQTIGQLLAKKGDYSVLGKLYGLTQDQIDRLQGTGAYAPKYVNPTGGGGGGGTQRTIAENMVPNGYVGQSSVAAYNYLLNQYKKAN